MGKYQKESTILAIILIGLEIVVLFMYGFFVRADDPIKVGSDIYAYYPWLQDVNVMILVGFGYLMTFLNHYGWSALGYTFIINAVGIQYYLLWHGFWKMVFENQGTGHLIEVGLI